MSLVNSINATPLIFFILKPILFCYNTCSNGVLNMAKMKKMDIIYEDKELLVINKPAGLLTIATEKEKIHTLYHQAREYVKKQNPKNKIFIVHRIDKDTSGIVVFAKNEKIKKDLQTNWNAIAYQREYIAIVEGKMEKDKDTIKSYLKENKMHQVYSTQVGEDLAITNYEVIAKSKAYSLLKINIATGRKNQIRVQFSELGHPIIGDKKYGCTKNPIGRMGLHASSLGLRFKNREYLWYAKIPMEFKRIFTRELEEYEKMGGK